MNAEERLLSIAQRLDELAGEDGPSELLTLSEEVGVVANYLAERKDPHANRHIPRYMAEIQQIVERAAAEILAERYGRHNVGNMSSSFTVSVPNPNHYAIPPTV